MREALEEREGPPEARQEEKRLRNELLKDWGYANTTSTPQ